jgi:5-methylcytosine-specific restriction enzyme A
VRQEFSKQVRRDAFVRAGGQCEGRPYGERCPVKLTIGKYHYDHDIPDGLGGEPTLENCVVLCIACHKDKTTKHDIPTIAKAKRVSDRHLGIRKPSKFACSKNSKFKKRLDGVVVLR